VAAGWVAGDEHAVLRAMKTVLRAIKTMNPRKLGDEPASRYNNRMTMNPYEAPQGLPTATPAPPPPPPPSSWRRGLGTLSLFLSALFALFTVALLAAYLYQRWNALYLDYSFIIVELSFAFLSLIFWFMGRLFQMSDPTSEESADE